MRVSTIPTILFFCIIFVFANNLFSTDNKPKTAPTAVTKPATKPAVTKPAPKPSATKTKPAAAVNANQEIPKKIKWLTWEEMVELNAKNPKKSE
jgi:hypothetical protein